MSFYLSLEPILQQLRIRQVLPHLISDGVLVDIGCDTTPIFLHQVSHRMARCIGIDEAVRNRTDGNITLKHCRIDHRLPLPDKLADTVTLLAVLEHLDYPEDIIRECYRILKPKGLLLITVPSPKNRLVLELLAKVNLVRPEMIHQHKHYFTHEYLQDILVKYHFRSVIVTGFQLGLNTLAIGRK